MQKHEEWLCARLPEWEAEGLIDSAAAERLRGRYAAAAKPAGGGNLAMLIVSGLGALLVGLGIIALFAANWAAMSRGVRSFVALLPLTVCSILALSGFAREWKARPFWEALGIFWTLAIWSGFGLVCQTYHMSDNVEGFVLACTLLCLPILYLTQSAVATVFWPIYGLIWFQMMEHIGLASVNGLCYLAMLAAQLPALVMLHKRVRFPRIYEFFGCNAVAVGLICIIFQFADEWTFGDKEFTVLLWTFIWVGVSFWVLAHLTRWRMMRVLAFLYVLPPILFAPSDEFREFTTAVLDSIPVLALVGLLTALTVSGGAFLLARKGEERLPTEKRIDLVIALGGLLIGGFLLLEPIPYALLLYILVVAALSLVQALRKLRLFQMNLSLGVLLYEILVKYLMTDWSFTAKGLILLACGLALLFTNVFIIRGRKQAAAKEVAQ